MGAPLDPSHIMQAATGFWVSKTLLSAVELGVFTQLDPRPLSASQLRERVGIHERSALDFFDALVALGFLEREGVGPQAVYSNTPQAATFLVRGKPTYLGLLEMLNARLYKYWGHLTDGLKTGRPQNEIRDSPGADLFKALYEDRARLEQFMAAMASIQMGNFQLLAEKLPWPSWKSMVDVGGASGALACVLAQRHAHLQCTTFDLPQVEPIARARVSAMKLEDRVQVVSGDFMKDAIPKADVVTMGNILHDWGLAEKRMLLEKAYAALPAGGAFVAIENVIDDERRKNVFGLLMSLNMLIETNDGFDYTGAQFAEWARQAGFARTEIVPLAGPGSAAIAYK